MNYELAKELEAAGFQARSEALPRNKFGIPSFDHDAVFFPDLSELIEACGDEFGSVGRDPDGRGWEAWSMDTKILIDACHSPEHAVARLWLALNRPVVE